MAAALTGPMSTIFSGLWLADNVGSFFEGGGAVFYHSPIQPEALHNTCLGWATWSNFIADADYNIFGYTALYYSAQGDQPRMGAASVRNCITCSQLTARSRTTTATNSSRRTPSAARRAMGVAVGQSRRRFTPHSVRIAFDDKQHKKSETFSGPVAFTTFGSEQYVWKNDGENSHADPDGPPVRHDRPGHG